MSYMNARPTDHRMTTAEWDHLFRFSCHCRPGRECRCRPDASLRQYFMDKAKNLARENELRADLYQEAWLRVGESASGLTLAFYKKQGFKAMDAYRKREQRENRVGSKTRFWEESRRVY